MNWTVEDLDRNVFIPVIEEFRGTANWVADIKKAKKMTEDEAMHIVRCYPALNLCARQIS
jgi:hypothetical protein